MKYVRFTEYFDSNGNTLYFYIPILKNEIEIENLKKLLKDNADFGVGETTLSEDDIDSLEDSEESYHKKLSGKLVISHLSKNDIDGYGFFNDGGIKDFIYDL